MRNVTPRRRPWWTVGRATGIGIASGAAAVLLSLFYPSYPASIGTFYFAALVVAAACGASILWITARDIVRNPRRGARVRPLRAFDLAIGLMLLGPSLFTLRRLWPELGFL